MLTITQIFNVIYTRYNYSEAARTIINQKLLNTLEDCHADQLSLEDNFKYSDALQAENDRILRGKNLLNRETVITLFANHFNILMLEQLIERNIHETKLNKMAAITNLVLNILQEIDIHLALHLRDRHYPGWQDGFFIHRIKDICDAIKARYKNQHSLSIQDYYQQVSTFLKSVMHIIFLLNNESTSIYTDPITAIIAEMDKKLYQLNQEDINHLAYIPKEILHYLDELLLERLIDSKMNSILHQLYNDANQTYEKLTKRMQRESMQHSSSYATTSSTSTNSSASSSRTVTPKPSPRSSYQSSGPLFKLHQDPSQENATSSSDCLSEKSAPPKNNQQ